MPSGVVTQRSERDQKIRPRKSNGRVRRMFPGAKPPHSSGYVRKRAGAINGGMKFCNSAL